MKVLDSIDREYSQKYCPHCYKEKSLTEFHKRKDMTLQSWCRDCDKQQQRDRYKSDPVYRKMKIKNRKRNSLIYRKRVFKKIQDNIICVRCGCDDPRFLEINHKNGGGAKEQHETKIYGRGFEMSILKGKRKTDDLELLCRPCNHIDYLERKFGEEVSLKVVWGEKD